MFLLTLLILELLYKEEQKWEWRTIFAQSNHLLVITKKKNRFELMFGLYRNDLSLSQSNGCTLKTIFGDANKKIKNQLSFLKYQFA